MRPRVVHQLVYDMDAETFGRCLKPGGNEVLVGTIGKVPGFDRTSTYYAKVRNLLQARWTFHGPMPWPLPRRR